MKFFRGITLLTLIFCMMTLTGCRKALRVFIKKPAQNVQTGVPQIQKIDDTQLAKLILKRKKTNIDVTRDPFAPLIQVKKDTKEVKKKALVSSSMMAVKKYKYMGTTKINDELVAFLKSDSKRGAFRVNDKIKDYTIKAIEDEKVILTNGDQTITLKKGGSK